MILVIGLWVLTVILLILTLVLEEEILKFCAGLTFIFSLLPATTYSWQYIASKSKAKLINESYNTHYTRDDIFFNGDFIEKQLMAKNSIVTNSTNSNVNLDIKTDGKAAQVIVAPNR
jgi:hypothetical protein